MVGKEEGTMAVSSMIPVAQLVSLFKTHHTDAIWMDYDEGADVLYVNFSRPVDADDSEMTEDDTIIRFKDGDTVGFTVLNASSR